MVLKYSIVAESLTELGYEELGYDVLKRPSEVLELVRTSGFDAVEFNSLIADKAKAKELSEIANSIGLKIPAVVGTWSGLIAKEHRDLAGPEEESRRRAIQYSKECIDLANELGARLFSIAACPFEPQYPLSEVPIGTLRKNFVRAVKDICQYAGDHNVTIALEPTNRYISYPHFLNTIDDALSLIEEIGSDYLGGVLADLFHMNIEEASISDSLRRAGKKLLHMHLRDSNKGVPGTGHIDFKALISTLKEIGFTGYMSMASVIPPHKQVTKTDVAKILEETVRYMKATENAIELQRRYYY